MNIQRTNFGKLIFTVFITVTFFTQYTELFANSRKTSMIARPNNSSSRSQALWVFSGSQNPNPITDKEARRQLIVDSSRSGVDKLYVSVYQPIPNSSGRRMYEDADIAQLNQQAHKMGRQEVWAAYGAPDWAAIGCDPNAFPLRRMSEVAAYNDANRRTARFDGVVLDIEPPEPQSEADFQALLNLYRCVRQTLPADIKLAVAIRFFWDTPIAYPVGGTVKPVYQHIIDMNLDNVIVMGYRDFAGTLNCSDGDGIICLDKDEIAYASRQNKTNLILIGLETLNPAAGGLLDKETFYEEGFFHLWDESQIVSSYFANSSGFGGYAIHNYRNAYLSDVSGWEITPLPLP